MATFYNQEDQDIYAGGDHFIPQQYYRLNKFNNTVAPVPPEITQQTTQNFGIPYTNAFTNAGGSGGGTGFGLFGDLDKSTLKTIQSGKWTGSEYEKTPRKIAQDASGNWKDVNTNQNVYHGNIDLKTPMQSIFGALTGKNTGGDPYAGTWTGTEWDDEFDPTVADKNLNAVQRWRAKKDFAIAQKKIARDEAIDAGITASDTEPSGGGAGGEGSGPVGPQFRDKDYADPGVDAEENQPYNNQGVKDGGRIGFQPGGPAGGASAGGDYGGNVNPEQEYAGRTFEETYRTDTPVIPPQDNFTVDTDLLSTSPNVEFNYSPNNLAHLRALIYNKDIVSEDDINLEGSVSGGIGPVDWSSYFDQEGVTGSNVGIGPVNTYISPNKNIDLSYTGNIGGYDIDARSNLQDTASLMASKNGWDIGLTHGPTGTDATLNKTWAWGGEPEQTYNNLSWRNDNPNLIYGMEGQNLRYGGLASIL